MTTARPARRQAVDIDARRRAVADAVHSTELEGGSVPADTRADMAEYENGGIDVDELVSRTLSRYGSAVDPHA